MTSPARADTDGDGVVDSAEDNDHDRLGNLGEQRFGTNPRRRDTDGDGVRDGAEDHDGDGRSNAREQDQRPVPKELRPSLATAKSERGRVSRGCYATWGSARLVRCRFGHKGSDTSIVLVGDSQARMLLEPMKSRRPAVWREGLERYLARMPRSTDVLFLGDVPWNRVDPVTCLRRHRDDMSKCTTPRQRLQQRPIELAQRAAVAKYGHHFGSFHTRICTYDPCPVVHGDVLIYRDKAHLTATFARRMTLSVRRLLRGTLATGAGR